MAEGIGIPGFEGADYSQLPVAYTIHDTDAYFAPSADARNPETVQLHIKGRVSDVVYKSEQPEEPLTEGHLQYPVGKDEFQVGEGDRIERRSGSEKIDMKTTYMWFIEEFSRASGGREVLNTRRSQGLGARDAKTWRGMQMRVEVKTKSYGTNRAGEEMKSERLMPVWVRLAESAAPVAATTATPAVGAPPAPPAYKEGDVVNGYVLIGGQWIAQPQAPAPPLPPSTPAPPLPPAPSPASAPPAPPAPSPGPSTPPSNGLDPDAYSRLRAIAQEVKGEANGMYMFFDRAFKMFPGDEGVRAQIMSPALYESLVR